jgi:hypothetical protein
VVTDHKAKNSPRKSLNCINDRRRSLTKCLILRGLDRIARTKLPARHLSSKERAWCTVDSASSVCSKCSCWRAQALVGLVTKNSTFFLEDETLLEAVAPGLERP